MIRQMEQDLHKMSDLKKIVFHVSPSQATLTRHSSSQKLSNLSPVLMVCTSAWVVDANKDVCDVTNKDVWHDVTCHVVD